MTMTLVETIEVGSGGAASIEFTSIPQDADDLLLVFSTRTTQAGTYASSQFLTINSDTTTDYTQIYLRAVFGVVQSQAQTNPSARYAEGAGNTATSNTFGNGQIYFPNYTSTTNKSYSVDLVSEDNTSSGGIIKIQAGSYPTSSAITSLALSEASQTFLQYSTVSLYKIVKA